MNTIEGHFEGKQAMLPQSRMWQSIKSQLHAERSSLLLALLCTLGFTLLTLLMPWPLKIIFDHVLLANDNHTIPVAVKPFLAFGPEWAILLLSSVIILIAILRGVFSYYQSYITSRVGFQMVFMLRKELFAHLQKLPLAFHAKSKSGEIISKLTADTNTLKDVFAESVLVIVTHVLTIVGMFIIMFFISWQLSLILLLTFPLLFTYLFRFYGNIKISVRKQRIKDGNIASGISELLGAILLVQAYGREDYEKEKFNKQNSMNLDESIKGARLESANSRVTEIVAALGTATVVIFGSIQALRHNLQPGDVLVFVAYVANIYKPVRQLAKLSSKFSRASVSIERIRDILDLEPQIVDNVNAKDAHQLKGDIQFDYVNFRYTDTSVSVLDNISFNIKHGEKVALVGESGAGKSTIAKLILRLYEPNSGSIIMDNVDIRNFTCESIRAQIGIVLQDTILFGSTIHENIAYGNLDATYQDVINTAKMVLAHDFIMNLPDGYETVIGERGCTLSGGQRQRISLARAMIKNPQIVIMDEPTTGLDSETNNIIMNTLHNYYIDKTVLLIAHQFSKLEHFDNIIVLRNGKIVEQGKHTQLLEKEGYYHQLYSHQQG